MSFVSADAGVGEDDLAFALKLADVADETTMAWWRPAGVAAERKSDGSLLTEADVATESAIRKLIAAHRPADSVLGEEQGAVGSSRRRWVVDPIDGTYAFAHGKQHWATLIALQVDHVTTVAVISAPAAGRRWWAIRGGGAYCDDEQIAVSSTTSLRNCRVDMHFASKNVPDMDRVRMVRLAAAISEAGVDGVGEWRYAPSFAAIADGTLDVVALSSPLAQLWDVAAPILVVEEAGGVVTNFEGEPRDVSDPSLSAGSYLMSNGILHAAAMKHLV